LRIFAENARENAQTAGNVKATRNNAETAKKNAKF
jgi:hypothetical protein